jgi:hypothetical protein
MIPKSEYLFSEKIMLQRTISASLHAALFCTQKKYILANV